MREQELRQALVDYGNALVACGLVQGTWGNLSVRLDEKYMLTTPSGLDYTRLTADDMVKVNLETLKYEGDKKPTSEKGLHAAIYLNRPEIGAVIHTHAKYSSVFAGTLYFLPKKSISLKPVKGLFISSVITNILFPRIGSIPGRNEGLLVIALFPVTL